MVSFLEERSDEKSEVPFSEKPEDTVTMRIFGGWKEEAKRKKQRRTGLFYYYDECGYNLYF